MCLLGKLTFLFGLLALAYFSYRFADNQYVQKQIYLERLASLHPLGWNTSFQIDWAAQPTQRKMLQNQQYVNSWYLSIGHGLVTVFIWTFI